MFSVHGMLYPIGMEGAMKPKETSYIHAEAYAAGELKHGPLALVDKNMPVIAIAPKDALLEKLKSNLQEVRARGGELHVLADEDTRMVAGEGLHVIRMPDHAGFLSPILHTVPLQLLAYHAALERGNDVDKPRNLAKSVTLEQAARVTRRARGILTIKGRCATTRRTPRRCRILMHRPRRDLHSSQFASCACL